MVLRSLADIIERIKSQRKTFFRLIVQWLIYSRSSLQKLISEDCNDLYKFDCLKNFMSPPTHVSNGMTLYINHRLDYIKLNPSKVNANG